MTDFRALLSTLADSGVEFIVVGGAAAIAHGVARLTLDLDIVYRRTPDSIRRLVTVISAMHPYLRGAPPGLPFHWDERTVKGGLNFTLTTDLGQLDLLGEITGGGDYDALLPYSEEMDIFGVKCHCLALEKLIDVKVAVGRPKDFEPISELKALLQEREARKRHE
jgi:predicted nucleotidyltransferase